MQKSLMTATLRATMAGMAFLALGAAQAQTASTIVNNGTLDFAGSISASTCSVKSGDRNKLVTLNAVKPSDFGGNANVTKGETTFSITLENCTIPVTGDDATKGLPTHAIVKFSGSNINASGRLDNRGTAKGVELTLSGPTAPVTLVAGDNKLEFTTAYYSTSTNIVTGTVKSQVDFDITYQ